MRVDLLDAAWGVALCIVVAVFRGWNTLEFGFVSLGFPCLLRLSSAGLIVILIPGCHWAYSALSV